MPAIATMKDDWTPARLAEDRARRKRFLGAVDNRPGFGAKTHTPAPAPKPVADPPAAVSLSDIRLSGPVVARMQMQYATVESHEAGEASSKVIKIQDVQNAVCYVFGMPRSVLLSKLRSAKVVRPRHIAFYLCKLLTRRSLPEIGRKFGGMDHTSVLHAVRKLEPIYPLIKSKIEDDNADLIDLVRATDMAWTMVFAQRDAEKREKYRQMNIARSLKRIGKDEDDTFRPIGDVAAEIMERLA